MQRTADNHQLTVKQGCRALPSMAACLFVLSVLLPGAAIAAVATTWPEALYNPQPLPDDVLLPLPCGGAMTFRWVEANGRAPAQASPALTPLYRQIGPFERHGSRYLLIGKYEVNQLQYRAVQAQAAGTDCPPPETSGRQVQSRVGWHDATGFAGDWSRWLIQNAEQIPDCATGAAPCLPRADGAPAFLRLPREAEWEYAARGGLVVTAAQFAEPTYPMSEGLAQHAWYSANAEGKPRPIGYRAANPLGLHDLYGNVEELMLEPYHDPRFPGQTGAAVVRGGSVHATPDALIASRRREVPLYGPEGAVRAPDNGFRLVAVPLPGAQRLTALASLPPPKAPRALSGHLQINVNVLSEVHVDGNLVGQASPGAPVNLTRLAVGAHRIGVNAEGYEPVSERHRVQANRWTQVAVIMTPASATFTWPAFTNSHLLVLAVVLTAGLVWVFYRRRMVAETGLENSGQRRQTVAEPQLDATDTPVAPRKPEPPPTRKPEHPFEPEMIALPGGTFWMGSPEDEPERFDREGPRHEVSIQPFAIGKYAVTFDEYDRFARETGRKLPDDRGWGRGKRPVISVSWDDAAAYAAWLSEQTGKGYRLPTEAEWEYAARAGTTTPFWTGRCIHTDQANYDGKYDYNGCGAKTGIYREKTVEVGSLPANPWGLHEVHGNVWEWVLDRWHKDYRGAPADGSAWETGDGSGRVVRGSSWSGKPRFARSAFRGRLLPEYRVDYLGFRLARTLPSEPQPAQSLPPTPQQPPTSPPLVEDPLERADNLIAAGNTTEAESILHSALAQEPTNTALTAKLLEVHYATGSRDRFLAGAEDLHTRFDEDDPLWQHIQEMGREMFPEHVLFGGSGGQKPQPATVSQPTLLKPDHPFEPEMIALPGGTFWMGSPEDEPERSNDESPRHEVGLQPFAISKYAVTFDEYDCFAWETGRRLPGDEGWDRGKRPVINVSWKDAVAYTEWLSEQTGKRYRLPTEAEWEYAARAGTTTPFWTGNCIHTDQANYNGYYDYAGCGAKTSLYRGKTVEVGSLPANPWGLQEVHGNVWEWTCSAYNKNYDGSESRCISTGATGLRVVRGGSWDSEPRGVRSALRSWDPPEHRSDSLGFRLARTLPP